VHIREKNRANSRERERENAKDTICVLIS